MDDLRRSGTRHLEAYAERLRSRVSAGGIAASTARNYFGYIRAALGWMVRHDELDTNPAEKDVVIDALPEDTSSRTDQQFWTPEQRERLLEHVSERAHDAVDADPKGQAARQALRDRALVGLLYFSAARVGEVARRRDDQRRGRDGLRWSEVNLDRGVMEILGKGEQARISHAIPSRVVADLRRHYQAQTPPTDDWPVFPTEHAPSRWTAAREELSTEDVETLVETAGSIDAALREHNVRPPAITTNGVRTRLQALCDAAGVEIDDHHGYLVPHGARRGAIGEVYKRDRGDAQDLGRHADLATTREAYSHLEVEEQRDRLDDHFDAIDE
jgi:integrase